MTYQLTNTSNVIRSADRAVIPPDPGNVDYRAYLEWVANGNQPAEAEPVDLSTLTP